MRFLVDHNLSPYMARAMNLVIAPDREVIVAKRDKFPPDTPDVEWLRMLGDEGDWAVITNDHRIRRSPAERLAFKQAGLIEFVTAPGLAKRPVVELTARLLLQWPRIEQQAELVARGSMLEIRLQGRFRPLPV